MEATEYIDGGRDEGPSGGEDAPDDWAAEAELRALTVPVDGHGQRVDRVLAALVPALSRSYLQQLIADGALRWRGQVCTKAAARVAAGDPLQIELRPTPQAQAFVPEPMALDVVHEDAHLLVIDKPVGLVVHPAAGHWSGTLLNGLLAHHAGAAALPRAGIVHRLDKDTSGLMLVAKTRPAMDALVAAIAARAVDRQYLALAGGRWHGDETLTIDRPVGRDPANRLRMAVVGSGKPAQTTVQVLAAGAEATLLACKLHTGRTHQIRVHLAQRGHPLVGDALYGGRALWGLTRQGLHAASLRLAHPVDGRPLAFWRPPPADLADALLAGGLRYNAPPPGHGLID